MAKNLVNHLEQYKGLAPGSEELVSLIIEHHMGWATAIAKSVARSWSLDWQIDGLDGGAYEGLLFCARRYDPEMGVPFRAYARRRIHEASTEEARKSKAWQRGTGSCTPEEEVAREVSAKLLHVFPELREGFLPSSEEGKGEQSVRASIRQLLSSASVISAFNDQGRDNPEIATEFNQLIDKINELELVHQEIIFNIYWKDLSMRKLADHWEIDELVVIREHKELLKYIFALVEGTRPNKVLKIRPGLRPIAQKLKDENKKSPFGGILDQSSVVSVLALLISAIGAIRW